MRSYVMRKLALLLIASVSVACTGIPDGVEPVQGFSLDRYLGTWYEIARLDHRFERDLSNVTAAYTLGEDGGVIVLNRGFNEKKGAWEQAQGKAYLIGAEDVGRIKVSFFGPFYGGYNIVELDQQEYGYAMVCGPDLSYLWILAREPVLQADVLNKLLTKAKDLGFPVEELIYPDFDRIEGTVF
jgi:apolipoprotein D and lipocalin family protein